MKKLLVVFLAIGLTGVFSPAIFAKDLKIGYVDIIKVLNDYEKTKKYDATLEEKRKEAEEKLTKKKADLEQMQKKLSVIKEGEKQKEQEKLTKAVEEYREIERTSFVDIKKARDEKMKEIIDDMDKVINTYAKKNDFTLIINENAVLYGDKVMDITSDILKIANKNYKK
ncbi:MAG: OmpH family outer membrane protein [Candidatus Omnitrophica bacterium]|nr:OmpH family outer membrane protein [Candidatus Omnitrophota bacterium]MBU2043968.1 OmpH family outer membrane protein [Candidatus Omnitrophota bacterium]MBU2251541.1 OmpH family outer membrane protein [Candidatus Omnitrophota bacterium]MBU2473425.1 OmpH family outer membrane protein [Candidatus Omnitrophota bacterium]